MNNVENFILLLGYNKTYNQKVQTVEAFIDHDIYYFETMCQSKYILCPAGDTSWSFRFYECLLCESLPIVLNWHHTYRTVQESTIKYKYILVNNIESEEFKSMNNNDNITKCAKTTPNQTRDKNMSKKHN